MVLSEKLHSYKIILASKSPRRQQLLEELGISFTVQVNEVDEDFSTDLKGADVALYLAKKKSDSFTEMPGPDTIIITADTIVCIDDMVLNKPQNYDEAFKMLRILSGKMHEVITGVCIKSADKNILFYNKTDVYFKSLSDEEISYYLEHYKPYDKAGAYGVQEWIGLIGLERINGSYHNVMGLPVQELYRQLGLLIGS
jgi:septum formation protein